MKFCGKATYIVAQCPGLGQSPEPNIYCPHCRSDKTRTGAGRKPQEASLHYRECKRFIRWVSVSSLTRVAEGGEA